MATPANTLPGLLAALGTQLRRPGVRLAAGVVLVAWSLAGLLAGRFGDGGWYLLTARGLLEGVVPYRDAPFPHPPLALAAALPAALLPGVPAVIAARALALLTHLAAIAVALACLPPARRRGAAWLALGLLALDPFAVLTLCAVKSYPPTALLLAAAALAAQRRRTTLAGACLGLAVGARVSALAALPALLLAHRRTPRSWRQALLGFAAGLALVYLPLALVAGWTWVDQLYLPLAVLRPVNAMTQLYLQAEVEPGWVAWLGRVAGSLARTLWSHAPLLALLALVACRRRRLELGPSFAAWTLVLAAPLHLLARRPYDEYQLILLPLALLVVADGLPEAPATPRPSPSRLVALALLLAAPSWWRGGRRTDLSGAATMVELSQAARQIQRHSPPGATLLTLDPYLVVASQRRVVPGLELGRFGLRRDRGASARGAGGVSLSQLVARLEAGVDPVLALPADDPTGLDPVPALQAAARGRYQVVAELPRYGEGQRTLQIWRRRGDP